MDRTGLRQTCRSGWRRFGKLWWLLCSPTEAAGWFQPVGEPQLAVRVLGAAEPGTGAELSGPT